MSIVYNWCFRIPNPGIYHWLQLYKINYYLQKNIQLDILKALMCHGAEDSPLNSSLQLIIVTNAPVQQMHFFGLWKEAGVTAEIPCRPPENMQPPREKALSFQGIQTWNSPHCSNTAKTAPKCCYLMCSICHINLIVTVSQRKCLASQLQGLGCGFLNRSSLVRMCLLPVCAPSRTAAF